MEQQIQKTNQQIRPGVKGAAEAPLLVQGEALVGGGGKAPRAKMVFSILQ